MELLPKLLKEMMARSASDLFLTAGTKPAVRVHGEIEFININPLTPDRMDKMSHLVMHEQAYKIFLKEHEISLGFDIPKLGRFRFNIFHQSRNTSMVIRAIQPDIPDYDSLGIPKVLQNIVMAKRGLVVVVGPSGSGKSTTLAAMLEHRNTNAASHIITVEDPIEYILHPKQSVINQREVGVDTHSYHNALVNALRQSPDVLMVGEIREQRIMEDVIEFTDTGHLCLTTLHANSASQTFERISNMFVEEMRDALCNTLAINIEAVVAQRLVPTIEGKRTVAVELLVGTSRVRDLIRRREFSSLVEVMEKDTQHGMQTMDQSLYELYRRERITAETALQFADSVSNMRLKMRLEAP